MRHLLLTRFNVRLNDEMPRPTDTWLRDRVERFETYTLPSVRSQTAQVDDWIIFCDAESPAWLLERLDGVGTLSLVDGPLWPERFPALVAGPLPLLTTRLDNDDAIARDFIATVRTTARNLESDAFVNVTNGLQLGAGRLYRRADLSNAFISRFETATCKTALGGEHPQAIREHRVVQVSTPPLWLQVVHEHNIENEVHGIRTSARELERFDVDVPVSDRGLALDRAVSALRLAGRVLSRPRRWRSAARVVRARMARRLSGESG